MTNTYRSETLAELAKAPVEITQPMQLEERLRAVVEAVGEWPATLTADERRNAALTVVLPHLRVLYGAVEVWERAAFVQADRANKLQDQLEAVKKRLEESLQLLND